MRFSRKTPFLVFFTFLIPFVLWGIFEVTYGSRVRLPAVQGPPKGRAAKGFVSSPPAPARQEKAGPIRRALEVKPVFQDRITIQVFTEDGNPLPGAQVFAVPPNVRWLSDYGQKLGATGPKGKIALPWIPPKGREKALLLVKKGFLNHPIFHPLPGKNYKILMEPSPESILYTRDRFGAPIRGVRIAISRETLPRASVLLSTKNELPGPDISKAIFLFFPDQEGVVKIQGPPSGKYHFRALAPSDHLSMIRGCDTNIITLPCPPTEITFGRFWAVAVKIKNDEILAFRKTRIKGQTLRFSGIGDMRILESSLSRKFKTPLVCAAVPSKPGVAPSVFFQVWLKKAGKKEFRVRLRKLDDSFKPLVYSFPPKEGGAFGEVLIQVDPSHPFLQNIPFDAVSPSKTSPLPMVCRKIVLGKRMSLPPGEYKIQSWGRNGQKILSEELDPKSFTVKRGKLTNVVLSLKTEVAPLKLVPLNPDGSFNKNTWVYFQKGGSTKWYRVPKRKKDEIFYLTCGLWEILFDAPGMKKGSLFVDVRPSKKPIAVELHLRREKRE